METKTSLRRCVLSVLVTILVVGGLCEGSRASELISVKVGGVLLNADFGAMPVALAQELGFYKAEGLEAKLVDFQGGGELMTALAANEVFIAEAGGPSSTRGTSVGVPTTIISQLKPSLVNWGLMVLPGSPIKSLSDLKSGMKIGITRSGSNTHLTGILIFAQAGLDPKDVAFVPLGSPANNLAALKSGQIDGMIIYSPTSVSLELEGKGKLVLDASKVMPHFSNYVMVGNPSFLKEKPEVVRKVLRAIYRAVVWMKANPKDTMTRMQAMYNLSPEVASELYRREINDFTSDGAIDIEGVKVVIEASVKYGFFQNKPPLEKAVDPQFTPVSLK